MLPCYFSKNSYITNTNIYVSKIVNCLGNAGVWHRTSLAA